MTGSLARELDSGSDQNRWLYRTPARAHASFIVSICSLELRGRNKFPPFFLNGPANQNQAGPSCDDSSEASGQVIGPDPAKLRRRVTVPAEMLAWARSQGLRARHLHWQSGICSGTQAARAIRY